MRPDPRHPPERDSGRIIYLGDVRRRRGTRRQAPNHHYLIAVVLAAAAGWGVWLAVLFSLQPARFLTYLAFFLPLSLALAATATLIIYGLEWRRGLFPSLSRSSRRGALVAAILIVNLAFQGAHRWTPVAGVLTLALALGIDVAASRIEHR